MIQVEPNKIYTNSNMAIKVKLPAYETRNVTGTFIDETDTIEDGKTLITYKGNTSQNGTPTPSSPIPVEVVTGYNSINVSNKNLYNPAWRNNQNNFWSTKCNVFETNGVFSITPTDTDWYVWAVKSTGSAYEELKCGQLFEFNEDTYTITFHNTLLNKNFVTYYDKDKISLGYSQKLTNSFVINKSDKEGAKYFSIRFGHVALENELTTTIQLETGNQATDYIQHQEQEHEVNLGKNLWGGFSYTRTHNYVTFTYNEDGTITANGTATSGAISIAASTALSNGYYAVLEPGTYTLSGGTGNGNIRLQAFNTDGTSILNLGSNTSGSFTLTEKTNVYLRVHITDGTTADNIEIKPQLEKGSQTLYAPYFEPIELCKIGDYQDRIYRQNGTWYLHKEINKIASYNGETISTDYISTTGSLTTGATIYYVLSTPTDTEITNQALISQLEEIWENLKTYEEETIISQVNSDLPFYLDVLMEI